MALKRWYNNGFSSKFWAAESTNLAYVTNSDDNTVSVIDGKTNTVTDTIKVGNNPFAVSVNPSTNLVYVTSAVDNTVSVIDGKMNTLIPFK